MEISQDVNDRYDENNNIPNYSKDPHQNYFSSGSNFSSSFYIILR